MPRGGRFSFRPSLKTPPRLRGGRTRLEARATNAAEQRVGTRKSVDIGAPGERVGAWQPLGLHKAHSKNKRSRWLAIEKEELSGQQATITSHPLLRCHFQFPNSSFARFPNLTTFPERLKGHDEGTFLC